MATRPYGKAPRPKSSKATAPAPLAEGELLIVIHNRHTIEQITHQVQIAMARLQDAGAYGVEKFRIRLEPRNAQGQPVILRDEAGQPITKMQIPEPATEPAYRPGPYDAPASRPEPPRSPETLVPFAEAVPVIER